MPEAKYVTVIFCGVQFVALTISSFELFEIVITESDLRTTRRDAVLRYNCLKVGYLGTRNSATSGIVTTVGMYRTMNGARFGRCRTSILWRLRLR